MKGTIVQCLQELVSNRFGKEKWEQALKSAGLPSSTLFLPFKDVDDSLVMKVVTAVCETLNISLPQAAEAFGEYWVMVYSQRLYPGFYKRCHTAKDFLLSMDSVHVTMTKNMPNARPPRFDYEWKDQQTLIMHYHSHRGLLDFMVGLAKGVGKFYDEQLEVTKMGSDKIQIRFPNS